LNFGIDQSNLYSSKFFDGCLDEVRIYSRVLSADEIDSLYTDFSKPKTPQNLTAQSTNSRITLQWDRNGEYNLHKYNIYRNTYPPAATLIDSVVASSPPDTFYVDTDVTEGQQYYYRITAVDSLSVESDFSGNVVTRPGGGLVAYYPFNGNADDESGNNHDGTVTGPVLTADKFGEPDCAYSFDGSNDYISIPDNADQRIRPPLSIAFWINPDDYSSSGRFILSKGDAAFRHYYFSINTVGAVTFGVEGYDQNTVLSTTTLNTSRWYHIVGIHDGFTLKLYVDGSLDSMETATNLGNPNHNQFLNFGIDQSNLYSSKFFDGRLDEVRIYSKALSLLEIDTLYNEFSKPSIPQNLVAVPGNGQVKISWNANPENTIHKYNIYRDTISPAATLIDSVVAASPPDTFYTDTDVTNGQHYYYRISAVDSSGRESSMSAEADAVPSDVIQVQVKVFLQGPYKAAGDTMTAILCPDSMDVIPLTSPHTEDARIVAEIPSGITDWVLVQLRTSKTGAAVVSRSAFLRKDGCIVADDGSTNYITMSADPGDYFIVVQHRNHLAVMSDEVHTLSIGSSSLYDFTTGLDKYEQSYAAFLEEGVYGMYAGDANHNQQVQNDDKNDYWKIQVGLAGYRSADFSLNGQVQNDDKNDIWKLNVGKGSQVIDP
ncbi:hypothetical protein JXO52_11070, partial [bacterium]|nr:hypothetical protein [bacterium]